VKECWQGEQAQGKMNKKKNITEKDLQAAIVHFLGKGGIIHKLPDQKTAGNHRVGHKYQSTELGGESSRS